MIMFFMIIIYTSLFFFIKNFLIKLTMHIHGKKNFFFPLKFIHIHINIGNQALKILANYF